MIQIIHECVCKFVPICVFVIKDLPGMKMEIVFLMASAFLLVHVDQMNTETNVETLAKKQTAMTISKIHPSVPNVSLYFIFSCFSLSFKIVRICAYAIKASVETWKVETVFLKACVTITRRTCTNMKSRQLKLNLLPCSLSLLAGSFLPNRSNKIEISPTPPILTMNLNAPYKTEISVNDQILKIIIVHRIVTKLM